MQFTLIDPVGLGENFAGFMHLEDERPGLVGERIWTERPQIEQRLVNLTTMETVIQKYLRNEFDSIEAYNEVAGEIAEPYRFLVVSDFPQGFSEEAVRRLTSVLRSGPRCGVFTLLLHDRKAAFPETFDPAVLEETSLHLRLEEDRTTFAVPGLDTLPLSLDDVPSDATLIDLVKGVGRAAAEAGRVEVPFETTRSSPRRTSGRRDGRDPHSTRPQRRVAAPGLVLGRGTAQHACRGKTGSGKSTLLNVITNPRRYSPDEIEFYLVDFKKGVEFKTYATHRLPHARAVAVESDREFGLSVLKGLDEELGRRGELYREAEVQDLAGWRTTHPDRPMPRVLLVIDEFQELFVTDDQLAQEASLLLDRLVRQGRAFGMHVVLGSQTLGGAYSLNRTTMGQMGVRIALACNEQDSMLILSDDNVAARRLAAGEAIYNDQGGLVEGNSPFQVCWLPMPREGYLGAPAFPANGRFAPPGTDGLRRQCPAHRAERPSGTASRPRRTGCPRRFPSPWARRSPSPRRRRRCCVARPARISSRWDSRRIPRWPPASPRSCRSRPPIASATSRSSSSTEPPRTIQRRPLAREGPPRDPGRAVPEAGEAIAELGWNSPVESRKTRSPRRTGSSPSTGSSGTSPATGGG